MGMDSDTSKESNSTTSPVNKTVFASIFAVYFIAASVVGIALEFSGFANRFELQTINRRFEARPWLNWSAASLNRLNPEALLKYHDAHEIPRRWWAWDYTLSWLIENNHPAVKHNIVIFNHSFEDEPPAEAANSHPWMKPLLEYPVSRATIANAIEFIAKSGARVIILDCDFPQYSKNDHVLAEAIHRCSTGSDFGKRVPILMTASITRKSQDRVLQLHTYSPPRGVLEKLAELEPNTDVVEKYTGSAGLLLDEDQVVRQLACYLPGRSGEDSQASVVIKALERMDEKIPVSLPKSMDIDFAGPPNSELYKIRPFWYLLDPEKKSMLSQPAQSSTSEPSLKDAIVIIGDGITDLHNTPYTNLGVNMRSGSEVLAQSLDTVSRGSWPIRSSVPEKIGYLLLSIMASGAVMAAVKSRPQNLVQDNSLHSGWHIMHTLPDLTLIGASLGVSWLIACLLFSHVGLVVPVVVPAVALITGALTASVWMAHHVQFEALRHELNQAKTRLALIHDKHEAELREQAAVARADAIQQDRERRREFGRRLNHDLKAPLSILNWTLAKLRSDGLNSSGAEDKLERLFKTAHRLFNLIAELSSAYDFEAQPQGLLSETRCNVKDVILDCTALHRAVADMMNSRVETDLPTEPVIAQAGVFQLTRVVDNLIGNALVHNPHGTRVKVKLTRGTDRHEIEISDNGVGIPEEKLGDRMIRGSEKGNSGLGMSIVHGLVREMNGELLIKSTSDRGTTIIVQVPAVVLDDNNVATRVSSEEIDETPSSPTAPANDTCSSKGAR